MTDDCGDGWMTTDIGRARLVRDGVFSQEGARKIGELLEAIRESHLALVAAPDDEATVKSLLAKPGNDAA